MVGGDRIADLPARGAFGIMAASDPVNLSGLIDDGKCFALAPAALAQVCAVTLDPVRVAVRGILGEVAQGRDVARHRAEARNRAAAEAAAERLTFSGLLKEWATQALLPGRTVMGARRFVRCEWHLLPTLLGPPAQ